jgi:hypothetical protein
LDGIVTGLPTFITAFWIVEHQVNLLAALDTEGMTAAIGSGIISSFKRCGQSAVDALDAALSGKSIVPPEIASALRKLDKID